MLCAGGMLIKVTPGDVFRSHLRCLGGGRFEISEDRISFVMVCYLRVLWNSFVRDIQGTLACIKGIGVWIRPQRTMLVVLLLRRSETYHDLEPVCQVERFGTVLQKYGQMQCLLRMCCVIVSCSSRARWFDRSLFHAAAIQSSFR